MSVIPFTPDEIANMPYEDPDGYTTAPNGGETIVGKSRWHIRYSRVFTNDTEYYRVRWSSGATEYQDEGPEDITVEVVYPHPTTTIVYKKAPL